MVLSETTADEANEAPRIIQREATRLRVQEARERLANGYGAKPEFQHELLLKFVNNEISAQVTIPLLATIIALALAFWAPVVEVAIWWCLVMGGRYVLMKTCKQFARTSIHDMNIAAWRKKLIFAEALYGTTWASVALVAFTSTNQSVHVFVFATLIVVLTIRLLFASTVLSIVNAGTFPITIALAIRFVLQNDPFYWAMALMALGIHTYFLFLAKGLHATVSAMLEYRGEKDLLVAELEKASSISDEARRRAEEANVAKSRFLATMSHELRTPLNAILGFSEVMKAELMGPLANDTYKGYADNIHSSGTHLLHLINEILDLSRIEAGKHELIEEPIHLIDVANDCQILLRLRADGKKIHFVEDFSNDLPQLWIDERAIRQVILNLLSNAIKFTPSGGTVTLSVGRHHNGDQFIRVTDTGPGIPAEEIPRVLKAFGQGSLAHENAEGGTGLGLPIVQSLIELHGGKFTLESELRVGTVAHATIPHGRTIQVNTSLSERAEQRRQSNQIDVTPPPTRTEVSATGIMSAPETTNSRDGIDQGVAPVPITTSPHEGSTPVSAVRATAFADVPTNVEADPVGRPTQSGSPHHPMKGQTSTADSHPIRKMQLIASEVAH